MAGLEVLRRFATEFNGKPPVTIRWWIGRTKKARASAAACWDRRHLPERIGRCRSRAHRSRRHPHGRCAAAVRRGNGPFPEADTGAEERGGLYRAAHRARARCWKSMELPLGVVLGTKGVERHAITFHGQEAHSGSTPMNVRRDALAACREAGAGNSVDRRQTPDAVCTMGSVKTFPGIVTAVVGRCEATLDQRDLDAAVLATMYREAQAKRANGSPARSDARWNGRASGTSSRSRFIRR